MDYRARTRGCKSIKTRARRIDLSGATAAAAVVVVGGSGHRGPKDNGPFDALVRGGGREDQGFIGRSNNNIKIIKPLERLYTTVYPPIYYNETRDTIVIILLYKRDADRGFFL